MKIKNKNTVVVCDHCGREHKLDIRTDDINLAAYHAKNMGLIIIGIMFEYTLYCDEVCRREADKWTE